MRLTTPKRISSHDVASAIEIVRCEPARVHPHPKRYLDDLIRGPWAKVALAATDANGRKYSCEVSSMLHAQAALIANRETRTAARYVGAVDDVLISAFDGDPGSAMLNAREIPASFIDAIRDAPASLRARVFRAELTDQELADFAGLDARDDQTFVKRTMRELLNEPLLRPRVDAGNLTTALDVIRSTGFKTNPDLLLSAAPEFFAPEVRDLTLWDLECVNIRAGG